MLSIKDLFNVEAVIPFEVENHTLNFHFRNATAEEELEYRRRTSRQRIKDNGTLESTDAALKAPIWLFERICTQVTLQNGTNEAVTVSKEDRSEIPENVKLDALAVFRSRVKKKEAEQLSD